jgi:hypothetical protein
MILVVSQALIPSWHGMADLWNKKEKKDSTQSELFWGLSGEQVFPSSEKRKKCIRKAAPFLL